MAYAEREAGYKEPLSLGGEEREAIPQGTTLPELVKELREWTDKKKVAEAEAEFAKSMIHVIATKAMPPLMEKLELDEFNVPGLNRIELRQEVYVHVKKDDIPAFHEWLRDNGHGDLIVPYVFPATKKAWATEQLSGGAALPDMATVAFVPTAKLLAPRKKK
jgi:hypothetical protein